jgi:hypothetical protein
MSPAAAEDVIHPGYLPFTPRHLADHFAPAGAQADHVAYYLTSARRAAAFESAPPAGTPADISRAIKWGRQMEKDERFWVAATLIAAVPCPEPRRASRRPTAPLPRRYPA